MPPTKLHGLKTSTSESIVSPTIWPSVASCRWRSGRFPEFPVGRCQRVRQHSRTASMARQSRSHGSPAAAPSASTERRFWAVLRCVRQTESQLSRHSRSGVHHESERYSRNSFRASVLNPMKSPNHALQRTAPGVTLAAADHPAAFARSQRAALRSR